MSLHRSRAILRHEVRLLVDDPGTLVFLLAMPMLMTVAMKPLFALSLEADGFAGASGAEHAVPGMAALFTSFTAGMAGIAFFREHGWGTWDRLRASRASSADIMVGKLGPVLLVSLLQLLGLFALGVILLGLEISGSSAALVLVIVAFAVAMLGFGMLVTALSRTSLQLNTFANLGAMVFAMLGGALVPITLLPDWVQTVARFTPTYWAMEGFLGVILEGDGISDVLPEVAVLTVFVALFFGLAAIKFRVEETKVYQG